MNKVFGRGRGVPLISEIMILKDGLPIFSYNNSGLGDPMLASGFLAALFQITKHEFKVGVKTIKMQSTFIHLKEMGPIMVVCVGDDENEVKVIAERIGSEFLESYSELLGSWDGDVGKFKDFHKKVAFILKRKNRFEKHIDAILNKLLSSDIVKGKGVGDATGTYSASR